METKRLFIGGLHSDIKENDLRYLNLNNNQSHLRDGSFMFSCITIVLTVVGVTFK